MLLLIKMNPTPAGVIDHHIDDVMHLSFIYVSFSCIFYFTATGGERKISLYCLLES